MDFDLLESYQAKVDLLNSLSLWLCQAVLNPDLLCLVRVEREFQIVFLNQTRPK